MTISNHIAVGALIAYVIKEPVLALPLAFASHFVLDSLPHHGVPGENALADLVRTRTFVLMLIIDLIGITILFSLLWTHPLMLVTGLVAASPDTVWIYRVFRHGKRNIIMPMNWLTRFHISIQWGEREWGILIELAVFGLAYTALTSVI